MFRKITIIALALIGTTAFADPGDYRAETGDLDFDRGPRVHDEVNPDCYSDSFEDDEGFGYDEGAFLFDCDEAAAEYELAKQDVKRALMALALCHNANDDSGDPSGVLPEGDPCYSQDQSLEDVYADMLRAQAEWKMACEFGGDPMKVTQVGGDLVFEIEEIEDICVTMTADIGAQMACE